MTANARVLAAYKLLRDVAESADPWLRHPDVETDVIRTAARLLRGRDDSRLPW